MNQSPTKRLVLGVTGGIAAYKAAELTRLLVKSGVDVQVVMTAAACEFVTPVTFQALSGKPVFSDQWDPRMANNMAHIDLSRAADAVLIAPASADFIAKLAHGLADDLLSTLCLARACPLWVAPAMNRQMWEHAATQRNIRQIDEDGIRLLGPASGDQACGEVGMGRMLEPPALVDEVIGWFQPKRLAGKRVVVTAGPTFEAIDTVRGLTNLSSGKMGYAVAQAALEAGATVTLVSGPTALQSPVGAQLVGVTSAAQMLEAVKGTIGGADVFIAVAAVADYTPNSPIGHKIKKTGAPMTLELKPTQDILALVAGLPKPPLCVGFAAESEHLQEYAQAKRRNKNIPLIAANLVQDAIGRDDNQLILFDDQGEHPLPRGPKLTQARLLIQHVAALLTRRQKTASRTTTKGIA